LEILRGGKFDPERARENEIPLKFWNPLQKGKTIEADGRIYTPDMVLGPARKGLKVTYVTDTRPFSGIADHAKGSDLMICEGMYGEPEKKQKALEHKHMTMQEAAALAEQAQPKQLWLTHYSPSMVRPDPFMDGIRKVFPASYPGRDGKMIELNFEGEPENE
jgi:ribonuclease Z